MLLLHEIHAADYMEAMAWGRNLAVGGFCSFGTNVSCGGRHLVSPNTRSGISPTTYRDNKGRLISITASIQIPTDKIRIINCYAPNGPGHRQRFFREQLQRHSRGLKRVLLGGDFNCVPNLHLDSMGRSLNWTKGYN